MQTIRVMEVPKIRAAFSGPIRTQEAFEAFNHWFSDYHASLACELAPRDFMWFNERENATEWVYALPAGAKKEDLGGFEVKELPGGLYAVGVCLDADLDKAEDWMRTRGKIQEWVEHSALFRLHDNKTDGAERWDMFHIVSPGWLQEKKYSVEDLYVPIQMK